MESALDYTNQIIALLNRAKEDYGFCSKQLSRLDKETQDVLHSIENENFNVVKGYQYAKQLKDIREHRRSVKLRNELLQILLSNIDIERLNAISKKLENKKRQQSSYTYTPRVINRQSK